MSFIIVKRADFVRSKFFLKQQDYDEVFTKILQYKIAEFNLAYKKGFSLEQLDMRFGLLEGLFTDIVLSPYICDKWLYLGFNMKKDPKKSVIRQLLDHFDMQELLSSVFAQPVKLQEFEPLVHGQPNWVLG